MKRLLGAATVVIFLAGTIAWAGAEPTPVPVGEWRFDEGSGTIAADSSSYGDDGKLVGNAAWVPGRFGSALSFDGATAFVEIPDGPQLEPTAAVSVGAWVEHLGSPGRYRYIVAKGESGCNSASYGLYTGANGGLAFYVANGGRGDTYVVSPDASTKAWDGHWHLVVGTYDGSAVRVYVDGNEVGSGTPRTGPVRYPSADSSSLFIGSYPNAQRFGTCEAGGFVGLIDDVEIWNRALSAAEVSALVPGGSPGGGQTPPGGTGPGGNKAQAPQIGHLRVSLSARSARRPRGRTVTGARITYTLTQAARLNYLVQIAEPGALVSGRCVKASKVQLRGHACLRLVTLAQFAHAGKAGTNSLHMSTRLWRKLAPHRYRLQATPSAQGMTGKTVSTTFVVPRR